MSMAVIKQGAEGRIYAHLSFQCLPSITKERFSKSYRIAHIDDKLTTSRMIQEARALKRARDIGVRTPRVYFVDKVNKSLTMEAIQAPTVRDWVMEFGHDQDQSTNLVELCHAIGIAIAKLHLANLIHGDLTTSNILVLIPQLTSLPNTVSRRLSSTTPINPLLQPQSVEDSCFASTKKLEVVMIDFGLAQTSANPEDKGVDLYVLERAIRSTHPTLESIMINSIFSAYKDHDHGAAKSVMNKLDEIRLRGRKRSMVG